MQIMDIWWWNKSRRAQSNTDYETWVEGGVVPTLNGFDNGDVRATTVVVMRMREGKPGGGKGPLLSENRSLTLATANDQSMFIFYGNRVADIRFQEDVINTLQARMGTGGNNMPIVAYPITGNAIGRQDHNGPNGPATGDENDPMFTLTSTDTHAVVGTLQARDYKGLNHEGARDGKAIVENTAVRRLTPLECERLQGFPDNWTEGQSDTHRYKQMGNAVAVPVVEWIIAGITEQECAGS